MEFILRRGAVGSCARWTAARYHETVRLYPDLSIDEIIETILLVRYLHDPTSSKKTKIQALTQGHRNLRFLVETILRVESSLDEVDEKTKALVKYIILGELSKKGVPSEFAW